ncbi:MAG: hypothetical protein E7K85_07685 [Clostridium sp.]|uniref:hypothetical protein n=1 Tax=Clostridium sp. TaxID=1506 RepID=UPI002911B1BB|nr:hypothetical protein [Clostridium sp.]MDU4428601.1 hypothetical protein [Clostridium sp.]MDU7460502.1 hypothetical protein [Clostridium sp.]
MSDVKEKKSFLQKANEYGSGNLKYFGAHPLFPKECKMNVTVNAEKLKIGTMLKKDEIPLDKIKRVSIETEKEVIERFTATRIALLGPFALAFKKKKVSKKKYLVIETEDFTLTFEGESMIAKVMAQKIYTNMKNIQF